MIKMKQIAYFVFGAGLFFQQALAAAEPPVVIGKGKRTDVTREDLLLDVERLPKPKQDEFFSDPLRVEKAIATIIRTKTFAAEARSRKLDETAEYKSKLKAEQEKLLSRMLLNAAAAEVKVPDLTSRARELYVANPDQHTEPEKARASHIMINLRGRSMEDAMQKMTEIRKEVLADPKRFGEIAAEKSEDETARQNKGDMGLLPRGKLTPEVEAAIFGMKLPGEISDIIRGPFGLHVVQIHEIVPKRLKPFEEVKEELLARAERAYTEAELYKQQEKWLKEEDFRIDPSAFEALVTLDEKQKRANSGSDKAPQPVKK